MNQPIASMDAPPRKRSRVLVVLFSQTGQLSAVTEQFIAPLMQQPTIDVHIEVLQPLPSYPFPWTLLSFLDAFPESAHMVPPRLAPLQLNGDETFDLIILPYQVWFLAPSPPMTAFIKHPIGRKLLAGRPVVTVIACRNMWLTAHEKMQGLLRDAGARLIDNVVFTDPSPALATFITTPRWLLTGKRNEFWGMPRAGVTQSQIDESRRFGVALRDALMRDGAPTTDAALLRGLGAVCVDPTLFISEKVGTRSFYLWGKLLLAAGSPGAWQRKPLLVVYAVFLVVMIVTVVPISLTIQALLRPLMHRWLTKIKSRFEMPSGSKRERFDVDGC